MIKHFSFDQFKSYFRATLPLGPLTLLLGANASGKSNAIEGIRLLSWMAKGQRLSDILSLQEKGTLQIRGFSSDYGYNGTREFSIGCSIDDDRINKWSDLSITLNNGPQDLTIIDESISSPAAGFPLYRVEKQTDSNFGHDLHVAYNNFAAGGKKPQIICQNSQAVFTQLTTPSRFAHGHLKAQEEIPNVAKIYQMLLDQILFLDPNPSRMRDYAFINEKELRGDGKNLSSVLYDLCVNKSCKNRVLEFIRSLPEQNITDIDFFITQRNEAMLKLHETFSGEGSMRDATVLSDGTLRVLAIAAAVLSAPEGSLVVIEEIDNGVHPSRAEALLENIQKTAALRDLQILITTHNPALMNAIPDNALADVVFCFRDVDHGYSQLVRFQDIQEFPEIVARGSLGSLVTQGIIDRYLRDKRSQKEKQDEKLKWLEQYSKK
jgi:predicted ATPase